MSKPVIMTIDDDLQVLNAVENDLRAHYHNEYRIVKSASGQDALEAVRQFKRRGTSLAIFLVDQRMPKMTGTEFLAEAKKYYPDSRTVLLTAYADTQAAISSINDIGLDYYLMKPWDPPEERLYPVLDDLLNDWKAGVTLPYEGIRVAGTLWSPTSHGVKDFLARNQIPYQWLDIEKDEQTRLMVEEANQRDKRLPVVFFPDGSFLVQPGFRELAEKIGMQTNAGNPFYDLAIIGAGPTGLAAAVYAASEGLRTILVEREAPGGQAGTSSRIENYLGFPSGLSGGDLTRRAVAQARRFGVEMITTREATGLRAEGSYRFVTLTGGDEICCHALLLATGVSVRRLDAPGIEALTGAGVYYGAALTEAVFFRDRDILVVGGANSAGQAAVFFSRYVHSVHMVIRSQGLESGMSQYLIDQIHAIPNIYLIPDSEVVEACGAERLESVNVIKRETKQISNLEAAAMFIFIGATPHSELAGSLVERDSAGFIRTGPDLIRNGQYPSVWSLKRDPFLLETSCPGIFAAGDVRHGSVKRIASAVGEGAVTVALVHQYLKTV